jgi:hypothetical protein
MTSPSEIKPIERLTKVQKDVLQRLKAGWTLESDWICGGAYLRKPGEAQRHVAWNTASSLYERAYITNDPNRYGHYVLNDYWIENSGLKLA